jgi:two-component system NtrC family sensor kinase
MAHRVSALRWNSGGKKRRKQRAGTDMKSKRRKAIQPQRRRARSAPRSGRAAAARDTALTRLTRERDEALEQQTATSEILGVISRSPTDVQLVLDTIVRAAVALCDSYDAVILLKDGDDLRIAAHHGPMTLDFAGAPISRDWVAGRTVVDRRPVHVHDLPAASDEFPLGSDIARRLKQRTVLGLPLLRDEQAIGCLFLRRTVVRPFSEKQIALLQTFADQAVIAIENVRLFEAEQQRTRELAKSLEDLRTAQDRLVQTEKLASLGQLTAGIAHEIKNPLNFVNNFSSVSVELIGELQATLGQVKADDKTRVEIAELADTLRDNLDKIVQHGKRADSIVKNMLLHSREGSGERRLVDVNALVEESLNLAYHGARAEKQGFNISLERSFDPAAGEVDVFPQEITRVLLNLIANGFYAATKRQGPAPNGGFEPTVSAATKSLGDRVEIAIRDNGAGIPTDVKEKMFNPFFTTKPAGEGTGLGLSISHDIIVKQHSGSIEVDTLPGEFTEFRIILPRAADKVTA